MKRQVLEAETEAMRSRPIALRLENWGRCLRLYVPGWNAPQPIGAEMASAEKGWRSGFRDMPGPNLTPGSDDVADARDIESAVTILPLYQHAVLKAWYVRRKSPSSCLADAAKASGRKRLRFSAFDAELEMAHALLIEALTVPAVIRKVRAKAMVSQLLA